MRMISFFLIAFSLHVSARGVSQTITFSGKNVPLAKVFTVITQQTNYFVFYNADLLQHAKPVTISAQRMNMKEFLAVVLKDQELAADIESNTIVISRKAPTISSQKVMDMMALPLMTDTRISGTVTDSLGNPLAGTSVSVKGSAVTTTTNAAGAFSLNATAGDVLVIAFVGYTTKEVPIRNGQQLAIVLTQVSNDLNNLVVVGFGTQRKTAVTGAISQVGAEVFATRPITNAAQALQGKIPNLNITFADGVPDRGATFNVRGFTSINGGSPLILIDNTPGDINLLNPQDIESVTVLKDAASAAIYGGKAAFGVVLITTKSGKSGKIKVHYGGNVGYSTPTRFPHVVSALDEATIQNEAWKGYIGSYNSTLNSTIDYLKQRQADPSLPEAGIDAAGNWIYGANTDWYEEFYNKKQSFTKHYISLAGGNENTKYYLSGGYLKQKGSFKVRPDVLERYSLDLKVDQKVSSWLSVSDNIQMMQSDYNSPNRFTVGSTTVYRYLSLFSNSYYPKYTPNGNLTDAGAYVYGGMLNGSFDKTLSRQIKNMLSFNTSFLKNKLHFNLVYSALLNTANNEMQNFRTAYEPKPGVIDSLGGTDYYKIANTDDINHTVNFYGDYAQNFDKHHFKVLVGYNQELEKYKYSYVQRNGNVSTGLASLNLTNSDVYYIGDNKYDIAMRGVFSRFNYDYDYKYLFEFNSRYDGTSRYPSASRYGFFPSASVGWVVSRESFFKSIPPAVVGNLKLRASYGVLGNQLSSSAFPYIQTMSISRGSYILDGLTQNQTSAPGAVASDLTWEKASTFDFGVDMSLLSNRLSLGFDWYNRVTRKMLTKGKTLPAVYGTTEPKQNAANLSTVGWEFSVEWKDKFTLGSKPLNYSVNLVLSDNVSTIIKYDNPSKLLSDYYAGEKIGEIWGYKTLGFFKTDDEYLKSAGQQKVSQIEYGVGLRHPLAGDIKFWDKNGDNAIDPGDNTVYKPGDRYVIGNSTPRYAFGVNMNFNYSGFDLNVFFQGIGKKDFWPGAESAIFWGSYNRWNQPIYTNMQNNYWTETNTDAYYPRLRSYQALSEGRSLYQVQTRYLQDASYIRLKDVSLGYTLPVTKWLKASSPVGLRLFFSGQNLFEWTKLSDVFDPEGTTADPSGGSSVGNGFLYPLNRTYTFGLDINF